VTLYHILSWKMTGREAVQSAGQNPLNVVTPGSEAATSSGFRRVAQTCCLLACLRFSEAADIAKYAMFAPPIGSDKKRNGTTLFFNDITAFNVVKYLILNNITALRLRNA
jgi:hypothetical protein